MKTPWRQVEELDPNRDYVAVATDLTPRHIRSTGAMFRGARRASAQIARAPGIVGFATSAAPFRKRYGTISLWRDHADVDAFVRSGEHHDLVRDLGPHLSSVSSRRWRVSGAAGRPTWADAAAQLADAR